MALARSGQSAATMLAVVTWTFKRDETQYLVPVRSRMVVSNLESAFAAARAGVGITVAFSYLVAESVKSGALIPLLQDFQPPPQPVSFVYSPNCFMPIKLRAFLDFALPRLSDLPKALHRAGGPRRGQHKERGQYATAKLYRAHQ